MSKTITQEPILQIQNLQKTYMLGKRPVNALNNLTLTVNRGEFIAIMGPSGSGKTTLLNIIGCIDKPTNGKILIDGTDVAATPEDKLYKVRRDKMGFVFQFSLLPYLRIEKLSCRWRAKSNRGKNEKNALKNSLT
jgi:putative ABC transport system ATP-binding protein